MTDVDSAETYSSVGWTSELSEQLTPPPRDVDVFPEISQRKIPPLNDDVLRYIIEAAVSPRAAAAFVYEAAALRDILTFTLVSWRFYCLTRPFLYRRVHLKTKQQVELLTKRNFAGDLPLRFLTIEGSALDHEGIWLFMRTIGHTLERVFVVDTSYGQRFLARCRYKWREFERHFPRLWEASNTFKYPYLLDISDADQPVPVPVPGLPHLRRQAILRLGHHYFTACWPSLQSLATVTDAKLKAKHWLLLLDLHPNLREVVFVIHPDHAELYFTQEVMALKQEFSRKYRNRATFYDVNPGLSRPSMLEAWFAEAVRRGTIWTMERKNWLAYG